MNLAFETLLIKKHIAQNITYHEQRLNKTRKEVFNCKDNIKIELENMPENGRCKVIYNEKIQKIEFAPYTKSKIYTLKCIDANIEYSYKWLDRKNIDELVLQKQNADDILIINNGFITDTSIANVAFFDDAKWITPIKPLLCGTTRQMLLQNGFLVEKEIKLEHLKPNFKVAVMNALRGFEEIGTISEVFI